MELFCPAAAGFRSQAGQEDLEVNNTVDGSLGSTATIKQQLVLQK